MHPINSIGRVLQVFNTRNSSRMFLHSDRSYFLCIILLCSNIHLCTQKILSQQYWKEFTIRNYFTAMRRTLTQYYRDGMKISLPYSDDLFQLLSINHWTYRRAYVVLSINCLQSSLSPPNSSFFMTFLFRCCLLRLFLLFKLMKFYDDDDLKCNHLWATFCCCEFVI